MFVNTLVLRTDHAGNPRSRSASAGVREGAEGTRTKICRLESRGRKCGPDRNLSRSPLFTGDVVFSKDPVGELNCKGLNVRPRRMAVKHEV